MTRLSQMDSDDYGREDAFIPFDGLPVGFDQPDEIQEIAVQGPMPVILTTHRYRGWQIDLLGDLSYGVYQTAVERDANGYVYECPTITECYAFVDRNTGDGLPWDGLS